MSFTDLNSGTDSTLESSASAVSWGPIIAGSVTAAATTVLLTLLGSGFGLTIVSPWSSQSASVTTFAVSTAIWLILIQWFSSALGGYLTGRLRTKWTGVHTNEVYFRDTAHGFITWALATVFVVALLGSAITSTIGAGFRAASSVASGAASATAAAAGAAAGDTSVSYFVDSLLRPAAPAPSTTANSADQAGGEVSRILLNAATTGTLPPEDRTYLDQVVASRAGLSEADAKARVNAVLARADAAKKSAAEAADSARKAGATAAFMGAFSLLIGAFIASVAAALGGQHRDADEEGYVAVAGEVYK